MKENVKKILDDYFVSQKWDIPEKDTAGEYLEVLQDFIVKSKIVGEHRWYEDEENISEIDGKFIRWYGYHTTGDANWRDMDLEIEWNDMEEVIPYEETVVKIKYKAV